MNLKILADIEQVIDKYEKQKKYGSIEVQINMQAGNVNNVYFIEKESKKY